MRLRSSLITPSLWSHLFSNDNLLIISVLESTFIPFRILLVFHVTTLRSSQVTDLIFMPRSIGLIVSSSSSSSSSSSLSLIPSTRGSLGHHRWFCNQFSPFFPVLHCPLGLAELHPACQWNPGSVEPYWQNSQKRPVEANQWGRQKAAEWVYICLTDCW